MGIIKTGQGLSTKKDPLAAVPEAIQQAKMQLGETEPDLAIVFSSADLAHPGLLKAIASNLTDIPVIGGSSSAIISSQGIFRQGLVVMLLSFLHNVFFNVACVKDIHTKTSLIAGQELSDQLLFGLKNVQRDIGILLTDGFVEDSASLIHGLQQRLGSSFPLIGASLSDILGLANSRLYFGQELIKNGAIGMLLGGKLNFGLAEKHGWQPLGKPREITKAERNIVYEIDNEAAVKLYEDYFGWGSVKLREELKRISVLYPVGIYLTGEKEYLLRNVLAIEPDGALVLQGDVPEGSTVRLMIGTKESCLQATQEALQEAKRSLQGHPISFVLVFDSISRYILLGRQAYKELEVIKKNVEKNTPIIGFYSYGEEAPLLATNYRGKTYLHNQTVTVLAVGG